MSVKDKYVDVLGAFGVSDFYYINSNKVLKYKYDDIWLSRVEGDKVLVGGKIPDSLYRRFASNKFVGRGSEKLLFNTPLELAEFLLVYDSERTSAVVNAIIFGDYSLPNNVEQPVDKLMLFKECHDYYQKLCGGIAGDREQFVSWCKNNSNQEELAHFIEWCREKERSCFSESDKIFMGGIVRAFENIANIRGSANTISILKLREYLSGDLFERILNYGKNVKSKDTAFVPTLVGDLCSLRNIIVPFIEPNVGLFELREVLKKVDVVTDGSAADYSITIYVDDNNSITFRGWDDSFLLIFRCGGSEYCSSVCLFENTKSDFVEVVGSGVMVRTTYPAMDNDSDGLAAQFVYNFDRDCVFVSDLSVDSKSQNFYMGNDINFADKEKRGYVVNSLRRVVDETLRAFGVRELEQKNRNSFR